MDALTLSSSLNSICKPQHLLIPFSKKHQTFVPRTHQFSVSCRSSGAATQVRRQVNDNFYKVLSLTPNSATIDDIKKAYRSMALRYHPDVCHDGSKKEESTRMFVQLNEAYETLSNPRLREEYDCELGLRSKKRGVGDESWRLRWQEQVAELNRRSRKEGSWGSRIRAQNMY